MAIRKHKTSEEVYGELFLLADPLLDTIRRKMHSFSPSMRVHTKEEKELDWKSKFGDQLGISYKIHVFASFALGAFKRDFFDVNVSLIYQPDTEGKVERVTRATVIVTVHTHEIQKYLEVERNKLKMDEMRRKCALLGENLKLRYKFPEQNLEVDFKEI